MSEDLIFLIPTFFAIALIYSSAGFGGGSSYLLVLALFSIDASKIPIIALTCNIAVVSGALFVFYKNNLLKIRRIIPLVLLSIPFAFLGGQLNIEQENYFLVLGLTLLVAALIMFFSPNKQQLNLPKFSNAIIGGGIGFLSGMVGIGGGIFLAPILYLSRWAEPKVIAATTAAFIFVNSVAGLIGQLKNHGMSVDPKTMAILATTVFIGGQIGSRFAAGKFDPIWVKRITAILIFYVAVKILLGL